MTLLRKRLLARLALAALAATCAASPSLGDGLLFPADSAFDPSRLVKFDGRIYEIDYEDSVSTLRVKQATVRKISYGKTRFVDVVTTSSGTYSTDGLFSKHIRYPGIHVTDHGRPMLIGNVIGFWTPGTGWVPQQMRDAGSFLMLTDPGYSK